ncbi:MBL fold metallo-hydrolase [Acidocella sp.]|uniref:MBL fold metallo-hydrolase n=1 Tax=Acidocella sp. TaxID=50710 RepID=UPI003D02E395
MGFLVEPVPPRGAAIEVMRGVSRIVADNPGVMTYHGTNSYLVEAAAGLAVIDPGPEDEAHVRDLLAAAGARPVTLILLTHTHADHFGALPALAAATGAPVAAFKSPAKAGFKPDIELADGDAVHGFTAVHTPGHAADHLCFAHHARDGRKALFSGDHVMSWSSSIVSPPEGDMGDYYRSLEALLRRDDDVFLPGHGPLLAQPRQLTAELLAHRQRRERAVLAALAERDWSVAGLAAKLYGKADLFLKAAAQRNVLAHLLKLKQEGTVGELEPEAQTHPDNLALAAMAEHNKAWRGRVSGLRADGVRRFGLRARAASSH